MFNNYNIALLATYDNPGHDDHDCTFTVTVKHVGKWPKSAGVGMGINEDHFDIDAVDVFGIDPQIDVSKSTADVPLSEVIDVVFKDFNISNPDLDRLKNFTKAFELLAKT